MFPIKRRLLFCDILGYTAIPNFQTDPDTVDPRTKYGSIEVCLDKNWLFGFDGFVPRYAILI